MKWLIKNVDYALVVVNSIITKGLVTLLFIWLLTVITTLIFPHYLLVLGVSLYILTLIGGFTLWVVYWILAIIDKVVN